MERAWIGEENCLRGEGGPVLGVLRVLLVSLCLGVSLLSFVSGGFCDIHWKKMVLLHGDLFIKVVAAKELKSVGKLMFKQLPDPYVKAYIGKGTILKTTEMNDTSEPVWNETFVAPFANFADALTFSVKHAGKSIGVVDIPFERIIQERNIDEWFPLRSEHVKRSSGQIHLNIVFTPALTDGNLYLGEVPNCYFPMRKGCKVKMYQDAACRADLLPSIHLSNGTNYQHSGCWEDLFHCIQKAEKFIYITGWSVWVHTILVRQEYDANSHFGELLKRKASKGVKVLLLLWDDQTSGNVFMGKEGLMGTKDEETRQFFAGTEVQARLVPRATDTKTKAHKRFFTNAVYTHHQKSVILDQPDERTGKKKIVAFVGGIDITTGRYDSQVHDLFTTLKTDEHKDDFYNNCIPDVDPEFGPREPWHDIHGYVEGPIARDVMQNFEERWKKQVAEESDRLFPIETEDIPWYGEEAYVTNPDDAEAWNVQYFRSIDERSAMFDPQILRESDVFFRKKGRPIEMSIQRAYVHYIRTAEKFIYIENQYFLGSSNEWKKGIFKDSLAATDGAMHVIAMEIALKICSKIRNGEHFCAFILIPLFPEGIPESGAVQEILCWQRNTVELMYGLIAEALKENKEKHPGKQATDFLSIFALGNRQYPPESAVENEIARMGRQMIYVHSKMMIVDDSVVIMGSANINQRSMDGGRDTEMAFGAFQNGYTVSACDGQLPKGEVHGFRMSLFAEHMGCNTYDWMLEPCNETAMRKAREIGAANWELYADDNLTEMPGHWMKYPYTIDSTTGTLFADPLNTEFPGTNAKVLGKEDFMMPDSATM